MAKLDEVSNILGNLDAKTDNIVEAIDRIEKHLNIINGTVNKHEAKTKVCDAKFDELEKKVGSAQFDYKLFAAIGGIVVIITIVMHALGF